MYFDPAGGQQKHIAYCYVIQYADSYVMQRPSSLVDTMGIIKLFNLTVMHQQCLVPTCFLTSWSQANHSMGLLLSSTWYRQDWALGFLEQVVNCVLSYKHTSVLTKLFVSSSVNFKSAWNLNLSLYFFCRGCTQKLTTIFSIAMLYQLQFLDHYFSLPIPQAVSLPRPFLLLQATTGLC